MNRTLGSEVAGTSDSFDVGLADHVQVRLRGPKLVVTRISRALEAVGFVVSGLGTERSNPNVWRLYANAKCDGLDWEGLDALKGADDS